MRLAIPQFVCEKTLATSVGFEPTTAGGRLECGLRSGPTGSREVNHVGKARASNTTGDSGPNGRVIITPKSNTDDEIADDSDAD
ncbi:hypothetical protein SprV_0401701800 [Sparganum proliferum]